jgi:hypothetical protein
MSVRGLNLLVCEAFMWRELAAKRGELAASVCGLKLLV